MADNNYQLDFSVSSEEADTIERRLGEFNDAFTANEKVQPLNVAIRDGAGRLVGGVKAATCLGWLYISDIWMEEQCRGNGLGTELLSAVEAEAARRGCSNAWLTTFSFQARPFYERTGYQLFSELPNYPRDESLYFLKKSIG